LDTQTLGAIPKVFPVFVVIAREAEAEVPNDVLGIEIVTQYIMHNA
jgi:hypothetical protein